MPTNEKQPKSKKQKSPSSADIGGPKRVSAQAFEMIRNQDQTGISGTGLVGEGVVFSNGKCVFCFESATPCVQVWDSFEAFKAVHITPHEPHNQTEIIWIGSKE